MKQNAPTRKTHAVIGPYSAVGAIAYLDGRSKEALFLKARRDELTAHIGGSPNAVQRMLIERAARLALRLELFDERDLTNPKYLDRDERKLLAYHNSLVRTLARLGIKGAPVKPPTLDDIANMIASGDAA